MYFESGNEIEFNNKGNWTEIKCVYSKVPDAIVPSPILNYVKKKFANEDIVMIEKTTYHYDVSLSNGVTLTFNDDLMIEDFDKEDVD